MALHTKSLIGRKTWVPLLVAASAVFTLAACGSDDETSGTGNSDTSGTGADTTDSKQVALLLPESTTPRYETRDRPAFEDALAEECSNCELLYFNADNSADKQLSQAESAIADGADLLMLGAVDSSAALAILERGNEAAIPVVAYYRPIPNGDIDYLLELDTFAAGQLQGEALVAHLEDTGVGDGTIVMINGAANDANMQPIKDGAHSAIDASGLTVGAEFDTPDWNPEEAQAEMDQAITQLGADGVDGVYAMNDGMAAGVIASLKAAGIDPIPPVTGLDADVAAIQRILAGDQFMTIYIDVEAGARTAAELAAAIVNGETPEPVETVNNGLKDVPVQRLQPTTVTAENLKEVIIDSGFLTPADICTGEYSQYCEAAGIS